MSGALIFTEKLLNTLYDHAVNGFPSEVVGILAGSKETNHVVKVHPLINERADTQNRYRVTGLTVYRASQALEAEGFDILGYYHSHPNHPSQYSEYDREHALPNLSYTIVSVMEGQIGSIQSWRLSEDRSVMVEEPISIINPQ